MRGADELIFVVNVFTELPQLLITLKSFCSTETWRCSGYCGECSVVWKCLQN